MIQRDGEFGGSGDPTAAVELTPAQIAAAELDATKYIQTEEYVEEVPVVEELNPLSMEEATDSTMPVWLWITIAIAICIGAYIVM